MKNAGGNIKVMATFLFILELVAGGIWLVVGFFLYFTSFSEHVSGTNSIILLIVSPACLILGSLVSYFFMYGFGQLVENSDILVENQKGQYIDSVFDDLRNTLNKENIQ